MDGTGTEDGTEDGTVGWFVIAAIVVVSTLTTAPSARAVERCLARHGSAS